VSLCRPALGLPLCRMDFCMGFHFHRTARYQPDEARYQACRCHAVNQM